MFCLQILVIFTACTFTYGVHKLCYTDYPELDGLLCYKSCRSNYNGVGPVCWGNCPSGTTDIGALCTKHTKGRGVGRPLHTCKSGYEKNLALCYPNCRSGYKGVGPVCWAYCNSGYTDDGAFCRKNAHVISRNVDSCPWHDKCGLCGGPWYNVCGQRRNCGESCPSGYRNDGCTCWRDVHIYAKDTYGRGVGEPMICSSSEDQQAGLCYDHCPSGFYGVGPVCWARCSGETIDTGTQCQKKSYGRGVGKVINCFKVPTCSDIGDCNVLQSNFTGLGDVQKFSALVCQQLYTSLKPWITIIQSFNSCYKNDQWGTLTVAYSLGAAAGVSVAGELGVAVDVDAKRGICYVGSCIGFKTDISIGAEFVIGWWKSIDSVPGKSTVIAAGVDIPGTEIGVGVGFVLADPSGEYIGTTFGVGIGIGVSPVEVGALSCNTPSDKLVNFTP